MQARFEIHHEEMCGQTTMIYECLCGKLKRESMPPRTCSPACEIEKTQLTIKMTCPCEDCNHVEVNLHCPNKDRPTTGLYDKPLPGIPEPELTESLPPTYHQATEQPPTYSQAIAEQQPVSYDNVMMAITTFQPEDIVRAWHTYRACQLSLLPPLLDELQSLQR